MIRRSMWLCGMVLGVCWLCVPSAHAVPVSVSYSGYIDQVNDPGGLLDPAVTLGAFFTVELEIVGTDTCHNPLQPGENPLLCDLLVNASGSTIYNQNYTSMDIVSWDPLVSVAAVAVSVSIAGWDLTTAWQGIAVYNDAPGFSGSPYDGWGPIYPCGTDLDPNDQCAFEDPFNPVPEGDYLAGVYLADSSGLQLDNKDFFVPTTDLSGWDSVRLMVTQPDVICGSDFDCPLATGTISPAMIPEPSTALLLGMGLAGLAAKRRRANTLR